jgi:hypothetical protein
MRMTYWLYRGKRIVGSVRAETGLTDREVIARALKSHDAVPLCDIDEAPYERRYAIQNAQVQRYFDGR